MRAVVDANGEAINELAAEPAGDTAEAERHDFEEKDGRRRRDAGAPARIHVEKADPLGPGAGRNCQPVDVAVHCRATQIDFKYSMRSRF